MGKSYGFIEISGVVAAMDALDIMCKTAEVEPRPSRSPWPMASLPILILKL